MVELKYCAATSEMFNCFTDFVPTCNDDPFNFLDLDSYAGRADAYLNAPLYEGCVEKSLHDFSTQYEDVAFSSLPVEVKIEVLDRINCLLSSVTVACDAGSGAVIGACVVSTSSFFIYRLLMPSSSLSVRDVCGFLSSYANLRMIAVREEYRGQGLGARLLGYCETLYKDNGFLSIGGDYPSREAELRCFFEKCGYRIFSKEYQAKMPVKGGWSVQFPIENAVERDQVPLHKIW